MPGDKKNQYLVDPTQFGLNEKQAAQVALLTEEQMGFAAALVRRHKDVEAAEAACTVLLDGKPELLARLTKDDYEAIAWYYEEDAKEPDPGQMSEACETVLDDRFGRTWTE